MLRKGWSGGQAEACGQGMATEKGLDGHSLFPFWLYLLYDLGLDPDDAHDLDLAVGVVVEPGATTVHLVRTPPYTHNCLNIEVGTHVFFAISRFCAKP